MPGWVGYEPQRLAALRSRAAEAAEDLRTIVSSDPSAVGALQAVRMARDHLEGGLLPLVGRILASESLLAWRSRVPNSAVHRSIAGWVGTDDELLDEYSDALNRLHAALSYNHSDIDGAWTYMTDTLHELRARAESDPRWLERLAGDDSTYVLERLAAALNLSVTEVVSPRPTDAVLQAAADLFAVAATNDEVAARLGALAFEAPVLGSLLPLASFPASVTVGVTRHVLARAGSDDTVDTPIYRDAALAAGDEALRALLTDQDAALDFLLDRDAVTHLLTLRLDQQDVEGVVGLGFGTAVHDDPARLGDGLTAFANLVAVADAERIGDGGARGVANSLGVYLGHFAFLEEGHDVMVSTDTDDPATASTTVIGSYDAVQELLEEVVSDEQAQLTLSLVTRGHTRSLLRAAATQLPAGISASDASMRLGASLGPPAELLRMTVLAMADENLERGAARSAAASRATDSIRTIGTAAGFLPSPLARGVSTAASPAADLLEWVMTRGDPEPVPDTGMVELAVMDMDFDVVEFVAAEPQMARKYGLDATARVVLTAYAARYRAEDAIGKKAVLHNQMRTYLMRLPVLDAGLTVIRTTSGFEDAPDR